jgi:hypothetical protein
MTTTLANQPTPNQFGKRRIAAKRPGRDSEIWTTEHFFVRLKIGGRPGLSTVASLLASQNCQGTVLRWLPMLQRQQDFRVELMLRRLGLALAYFVASVYFLSIVLPSVYCLRQGCRGPGELDAFMPAFGLTPFGAIATAFSLRNAVQHIRKREPWSWAFWLPAIIFALVLLGVIAFIVWFIYETASHR